MDYRESVDWLYRQLPMYQRIGAAAFKKDLQKTRALMAYLDHPEQKFPAIHIAGTNGKGSVSHYLAALFQKANYTTGLYTSPHLIDFRERIRLNGEWLAEEKVVHFVNRHREFLQAQGLSFFEMTVGLAYATFAEEQVNMAVIETGMGGRLDSTNVIHPLLSIITNISLDHAQFLGPTLPLIAGEKAGIIKSGTPVLIGEKQKETAPVFEQRAAEQQSPLYYAEELVEPAELAAFHCDTPYQRRNLRTTLAALKLLQKKHPLAWPQSPQFIREAHQITGLRGRWETLRWQPRVIADTGHNEAAVQLNMAQLEQESFGELHLIWGTVNDKDLQPILALLPQKARYYWCRPEVPRGLPAEELQKLAAAKGLQGASYPSVKAAYAAALAQAQADDLLFISGSTFVVAEVL